MDKRIEFGSSAERWGVFEVRLSGPADGNPFTEQSISGVFRGENESVETYGFYDGSGIYIIRFMPSFEGEYSFEIRSSFSKETYRGSFKVKPPSKNNHGPVRTANTYHFRYADGTAYYPVGTTCYVWELQSDEMIEKTLDALERSGFNKIRFCVFPKHYIYNFNEPRSYPYEGRPMDSSVLTPDNFNEYGGCAEGNSWDLTRFEPGYFRHIEKCITALGRIGVEADVILMHPYDRWGFSKMPRSADELYIKYVTARFGAFRNVWWSLANEYDLMEHKKPEDWEHYASLIAERDAYSHLCSIHNCYPVYDFSRPWVTHCSMQKQDIYRTACEINEWREKYKKPVVLDEIAYEGNIQYGWGNITAEELIRRFWEVSVRGAYATHGETYTENEDMIWWAHGGELCGESWKRIKFLLSILGETPGIGLREKQMAWDELCAVPDDEKLAEETGYHLFYYSFMRPVFRKYYFDDSVKYRVEVIDTWNMTVEDRGVYTGTFKIDLPSRQYIAVRIRKADTDRAQS